MAALRGGHLLPLARLAMGLRVAHTCGVAISKDAGLSPASPQPLLGQSPRCPARTRGYSPSPTSGRVCTEQSETIETPGTLPLLRARSSRRQGMGHQCHNTSQSPGQAACGGFLPAGHRAGLGPGPVHRKDVWPPPWQSHTPQGHPRTKAQRQPSRFLIPRAHLRPPFSHSPAGPRGDAEGQVPGQCGSGPESPPHTSSATQTRALARKSGTTVPLGVVGNGE